MEARILSRLELYELVWSKPMTQLAKDFGLSDKGLAKKCIKHKIPTPSLGYWAKVQNGQKALKVLLPKLKEKEHHLRLVNFSAPKEIEPIIKQVRARTNKKEIPQNHLSALNDDVKELVIRKYHPILAAIRKNAGPPSKHDQYPRLSFIGDAPRFGLKITKGTFVRTFNFLEQLVRTLKLINIELVSIEKNFNKDKVAVFNFNDITISFEIREKLKRVENSPPENKGGRYVFWHQKYDYHPTGILEFELMEYLHGLRTCWRDTNSKSLEKQISIISSTIEEAFEVKRLAKIEAHNKAEREKVEQAERAKREQLELVAKQQQFHLEKLAHDFDRAEKLRNFISALSSNCEASPEITEWLIWATEYAENIDPVNDPQSIVAIHNKLNELDKYQLNSLKW
jgi:hypothetical protein